MMGNAKTLKAMKYLGVLACATMAAALGGCDVHEKFVYASTPAVPQTISLINTSTGEQLWTYDIPPGEELKLWFTNQTEQANAQGYDEMVWTVGRVGEGVPPVTNRMRVPPPMSRRLDGGVRPPEVQKVTVPNPGEPARPLPTPTR